VLQIKTELETYSIQYLGKISNGQNPWEELSRGAGSRVEKRRVRGKSPKVIQI
jgi:hypothetical protein